jgi:hypothetical protein
LVAPFEGATSAYFNDAGRSVRVGLVPTVAPAATARTRKYTVPVGVAALVPRATALNVVVVLAPAAGKVPPEYVCVVVVLPVKFVLVE